jgi:ubiquinone/menaquinone biosynthesis C-methylase UbiE
MQISSSEAPVVGHQTSPEDGEVRKTYFESVAPFWKDIYNLDTVYARIHQERRIAVLKIVAEQLRLPPGSRILEIGCGSGTTAVALAQQGFSLTALDIAEGMLASARECAIQAGVEDRVDLGLGDAHNLRFAENCFSAVLAIGVLPWLPSVSEPLREMARVLRPGGYLITTVDNRGRLDRLIDPVKWAHPFTIGLLRRLGWLAPAKAAPSYLVSIRNFDRQLQQAGLEKVSGMTIGFGPFSFLKLRLPEPLGLRVHGFLQRAADRNIPFLSNAGAQYLVVGRKPA